MERRLDLTISGSLMYLRSRALGEHDTDWGPGNRTQGVAILDGLLLLDPLSDEEFGADVILRTPERFSPDKRAQRRLQLPFALQDSAEFRLGSPSEELPVDRGIAPGDYTLIYEICLGRDVFYILTLLPQPCTAAIALKADGWGLKQGQALPPGIF